MNYSVLVVEDDESILDLIEIYLENENYIIKKQHVQRKQLDILRKKNLI